MNGREGFKIYIWDNGEDFLDHSIWFVESDLAESVVTDILNAAVDQRSRRGGVVAIVPAQHIQRQQMRVESLANWFTCYGDELVDWRNRTVHESLRALPLTAARELAYRLYPSNAEIVAEQLNFPS